MSTTISTSLLHTIERIFGKNSFSIQPDILLQHSIDRSFHRRRLPSVVIWPKTAESIGKLLKIASKPGIPITAYAGGSSLEGNPIPIDGGIVLDMSKMNRILHVFKNDFQVEVEPGIIGDDLNNQLSKYNLFFPAFAGSSYIATIGGMIANNAGGMYAVKYGVVGDWVMKLEVVLPSGKIVHVGSRSIKSVAGYDLKSLFIGSEGTLGIITKAILRVVSLPPDKQALLASFPSIDQAFSASYDVISEGLDPGAIEFMEAEYVNLVNKVKPFGWPEQSSLIVEFHGTQKTNEKAMSELREIYARHGGKIFYEAKDVKSLKVVWDGRRAVRPVVSQLFPGSGILPGDIGVPLSHIPEFIKKSKSFGKQHGVQTYIFGHMGDGNFHVWVFYKMGDTDSLKSATRVSEATVSLALKLGGTCTGEHGVGIGKRKYLVKEHPTSISLMKDIKLLIDPKGILNPGKIFL